MYLAAQLCRRHVSARIEFAIHPFRFADARCRGAEDQGHARRTVTFYRFACAFVEAVLVQAEPGQAMVARIPMFQRDRQHRFFDAGNTADPARQWRRPEIIFHKSTFALQERMRECAHAASGGAGGGKGGDGERRDAGRQESDTGEGGTPV